MRKPRYKEGDRIKLGLQHPLETQKPGGELKKGEPYTVEHHIWRGGKWYVGLVEKGPLYAYEEISFTHYESFLTA
jgi:hypothetical protein